MKMQPKSHVPWLLRPSAWSVRIGLLAFLIMPYSDCRTARAAGIQTKERRESALLPGKRVEVDAGISCTDQICAARQPKTNAFYVVYTKSSASGQVQSRGGYYGDSRDSRDLWIATVHDAKVTSRERLATNASTWQSRTVAVAADPNSADVAVAFQKNANMILIPSVTHPEQQIQVKSDYGITCPSVTFDPKTRRPLVVCNSTGDNNLVCATLDGETLTARILSWSDAHGQTVLFRPGSADRCIAYETLAWDNHPNAVLFDGQSDIGHAVYNAGNYVGGSSFAFDSSGKPHVVFVDTNERCIKHAVWAGQQWTLQTVDNTLFASGSAGWRVLPIMTSTAITRSGRVFISYTDGQDPGGTSGAKRIKIARWDGDRWQTCGVTETIETPVGHCTTSMAMESPTAAVAFIGGGKAWILLGLE